MTLDGPKTWHNVLLLLEGETVKLPAAKNIYSEDIVISTNVAIFWTSNNPIKHRGSYNRTDDRETEMMAARWKNYEFREQFFSTRARKSASFPKMFCKISIFFIKSMQLLLLQKFQACYDKLRYIFLKLPIYYFYKNQGSVW